MLNLNAIGLDINIVQEVVNYTKVRLNDLCRSKSKEALALYEQRYLPNDVIKKLCEEIYGCSLYEPLTNYIPESIVNLFRDTGMVPVAYMPMVNMVTAVYLPEDGDRSKEVDTSLKIEAYPTTLYYYLQQYQVLYGTHPMLSDIPCKTIFDSIVREAVMLGASDITISTLGERSRVYYNVRKKQVNSQRICSSSMITDIITFMTIKSPFDFTIREPKYVGIDLCKGYRGRAVINTKYKGYVITIRVSPNEAYHYGLDNLGLSAKTVKWMRENVLDKETGLRLFVGETMSGKNTTALAVLEELQQTGQEKVVSVEMPVEQELPSIEQIEAGNEEEFRSNIRSLIRQNPTFVYITEITDKTGLDTVQVTNTGKRVLSTIHANSVGDVISRLIDITGLSSDRIIQTLHSVVYQSLVRDEENDKLYPRNTYVRFTEELKYQLYGKSLGEILKIIKEKECGDE